MCDGRSWCGSKSGGVSLDAVHVGEAEKIVQVMAAHAEGSKPAIDRPGDARCRGVFEGSGPRH